MIVNSKCIANHDRKQRKTDGRAMDTVKVENCEDKS